MSAQFDHEKLHVYRTSLDFVRLVNDLNSIIPTRHRNAREQLIRACQSIPLNIAEGNGKRHAAERKRFLEIARGSAMECAAILDVLVTVGAVDETQVIPGKQLLFRIVSMLSKMTDQRDTVRESGASYTGDPSDDYDYDYDYDNEHEHENAERA